MTGESGGSDMTASQNMALLGMENLVSPIANNIIATQKCSTLRRSCKAPAIPKTTSSCKISAHKLLKALATQNAALDIISGFVATQQMGDLQHAGQEYISAMNQPDTRQADGSRRRRRIRCWSIRIKPACRRILTTSTSPQFPA